MLICLTSHAIDEILQQASTSVCSVLFQSFLVPVVRVITTLVPKPEARNTQDALRVNTNRVSLGVGEQSSSAPS
jgi:hypothetical protein